MFALTRNVLRINSDPAHVPVPTTGISATRARILTVALANIGQANARTQRMGLNATLATMLLAESTRIEQATALGRQTDLNASSNRHVLLVSSYLQTAKPRAVSVRAAQTINTKPQLATGKSLASSSLSVKLAKLCLLIPSRQRELATHARPTHTSRPKSIDK
jgi:hypothetical protein